MRNDAERRDLSSLRFICLRSSSAFVYLSRLLAPNLVAEYNELVSTPASCDETKNATASLLGGSAVVAGRTARQMRGAVTAGLTRCHAPHDLSTLR